MPACASKYVYLKPLEPQGDLVKKVLSTFEFSTRKSLS
jgi:hypothetical protein